MVDGGMNSDLPIMGSISSAASMGPILWRR
jgi:hypothetical protein